MDLWCLCGSNDFLFENHQHESLNEIIEMFQLGDLQAKVLVFYMMWFQSLSFPWFHMNDYKIHKKGFPIIYIVFNFFNF